MVHWIYLLMRICWHALLSSSIPLECICTLLVGQHSDINEKHNDISLLYLACKAAFWGLICCLLEHGADLTLPHFQISTLSVSPENNLKKNDSFS
jgi:hypothetical protein